MCNLFLFKPIILLNFINIIEMIEKVARVPWHYSYVPLLVRVCILCVLITYIVPTYMQLKGSDHLLGCKIPRNVGDLIDYTASHTRRQLSHILSYLSNMDLRTKNNTVTYKRLA
jgi:hypothetical protein